MYEFFFDILKRDMMDQFQHVFVGTFVVGLRLCNVFLCLLRMLQLLLASEVLESTSRINLWTRWTVV